MTELKAQIAFDLIPVVRHLYNGGVLLVDGATNRIHLSENLFHATFPEIKEAEGYDSDLYPWRYSVTIDGVEFFALSEVSRWDGE